MKKATRSHSTISNQLLSLALVTSICLPLPSFAAGVKLATSPLSTSAANPVKPNIVFVLDNSGSMAWDHMPDDTSDAGSNVVWSYGYYGLRSSQCNQVYYNPSTTYDPPVYADGSSYADADFNNALQNGFNSGSTAVDLETNFKASADINSDTLGQSGYYYSYSGTQTTPSQKNYNSTTNPFAIECHDSTGSSVSAIAPVNGVKALTGGAPTTAGSGVFTKHRYASINTTTIKISGTGGTTSPYASVSGITVNGVQIMSAASATSSGISNTTMATNIAAKINLCTAAVTGNCTATGYSASAGSGVVYISYTGATSPSDYTPVISLVSSAGSSIGSITLTPDVFPITTASGLTNFANWYSYYRTRLLMMKTAAGHAFSNLDENYRVGLIKISDSANPVVFVDTFWDNANASLGATSTQRTTWYNALYNMAVSGSTPLRQALADTGRYYAHKLSGTDPVQYSCQQNFAIMSTDGYWNTGSGYKLDGSTAVGTQDSGVAKPMDDGGVVDSTVTTTYTRTTYQSAGSKINWSDSKCSGGKVRLQSKVQTQNCSVTTSAAGVVGPTVCTTWGGGTWSYVSPFTSNSATCVTSVTVPPNTAAVQSGSPVTTTAGTGGSSNSLADVAMYYYTTDLRDTSLSNCTGALGNDVCDDNVFINGTDNQNQQHMTTFTLGMGASGLMQYSPSYLSDTTGATTPPCDSAPDYVAVALGCPAKSSVTPPVCSWQADGTNCTWPIPGMSGSNGLLTNIDDLWHAAVNGRGAYFSATSPETLATGLSNALVGIKARKGAAAAAATSTLNPISGNNQAFVASYTTIVWKGNLEARGINTDTGEINENADWCVENVAAGSCVAPSSVVNITSGSTTSAYCVTPSSTICANGTLNGTDCYVKVATTCNGTMAGTVLDISDTRTILTANSTSTALINFDAAYAAANPGFFDSAHISGLGQWASLDSSQQANATGANLVNYLRGQYGYEDRTSNPLTNRLYRKRDYVMGDALESQPAYLSKPVFSYSYPGYSNFVTAQAGRAGTVYMGTNDGMMHAFASSNGAERWAYIPSMVVPNLWKLANTDYSTAGKHRNFVNGSPITTDICTANCTLTSATWKTILVGGLNGGGRGFYALDITNPASPALLWEFKPTGVTGHADADLGYSYGQPVVTQKNDGTWVVLVTSGYNNGTDSAEPVDDQANPIVLSSNTPTGSGIGYLYVLNASNGTIISKISTGVGTAANPSGLAKIAGYNVEAGGNKVSYVYGGDLLGNLWRFDINDSATATIGTGSAMKFASLYSDAAGTSPQPITTTPVLGNIAGKRVVFIGTGKYLESNDVNSTQKQTEYAIKDNDETATLINPRTTLVQQTLTNTSGTNNRSSSSNAVDFYTGRGWYVDFPDSKERVNIDARLIQGTLLVPTIVPLNSDCAPGGYGWLNYFDYKTGGAVAGAVSGVKYDSTIVGINIIYVQGKPVVSAVTSSNPTPDIQTGIGFAGSAANFTGKRVIWRGIMP